MRMDYELRCEEQEDDDEGDECVQFTHKRFCRSDDTGDFELPGKYFPNFQMLYDKKTNIFKAIAFHQPRPSIAHMRDDSFTDKTQVLKNEIQSIAGAVGLLYILERSEDGTISNCSASTFAIYEVRGKKIGITTLHTAAANNINLNTSRFFVDESDTRWMDKTLVVSGDFNNCISEFSEVFIHMGALAKRSEYLNSLIPENNAYRINLDPEFDQCSEPVLDIMMFEIPAAMQSWPYLHFAPNKPMKDNLTLSIAYHTTAGGRKGSQQEYLFTTRYPPSSDQVVWINRSLGVGKVVAVGEGLVTIINSTTCTASGSPLLNEQLEVFAINLGGFYDDPGDPAKQPTTEWGKVAENDPFLFDVKLPGGAAGRRAKKNRNIALSVFHSGFVSMLQAIAP